jgi:hypothetical protein
VARLAPPRTVVLVAALRPITRITSPHSSQLWRIDQLTDGTYRIMPKAVPNSTEPLVLTSVGYSTPTLAKFDPNSDKARWNFKTP